METKLGVLDNFIGLADNIFIGGALANGFLKAEGLILAIPLQTKKHQWKNTSIIQKLFSLKM